MGILLHCAGPKIRIQPKQKHLLVAPSQIPPFWSPHPKNLYETHIMYMVISICKCLCVSRYACINMYTYIPAYIYNACIHK